MENRNVFNTVQEAPLGKPIINTKWVFTKKENNKGESIRWKARSVAMGTQMKNYELETETYSQVIDYTFIRYLISLAAKYNLSLEILDVISLPIRKLKRRNLC